MMFKKKKKRSQKFEAGVYKELSHTTISLPLFSGILASLSAATVLAPDDIPTCKSQKDNIKIKKLCEKQTSSSQSTEANESFQHLHALSLK